MKTRLLIIGGLVAYLAWKATGLNSFVNHLRYSIKSFSFPYIKSGYLVFPIIMVVDNNSNVSFTLYRIITTVYMYLNGAWVQLGSSKPSAEGYPIQPNMRNEIKIEPQISLTELAKNNLSIILSNPLDLVNQKFKVHVQVIKAGKVVAEEKSYIPSSGESLSGLNGVLI